MIDRVWPMARPISVPKAKPVRPAICLTCRRQPRCLIAKHGHGGWIEACSLYKRRGKRG
jgi:hypothetical protein